MNMCNFIKCVTCFTLLVFTPCGVLLAQERLPAVDQQASSSVDDIDSARIREEAEYYDEFITLGTDDGIGGADFQAFERNHTKDLIRSFIPPLLRPSFVGHAFVLPPKTWQFSASGRTATVEGYDFFRNHRPNRAVFENFEVDRQFVDLDLFYGFDLGREHLHNFTVRLNLPISAAQTQGFIHPNGAQLIDVYNEGENYELGDVGLFLKKKFVDQAVFPVQIAGAVGVRFPSGSNHEKFNDDSHIKVVRPNIALLPSPPGPGVPPPGEPPAAPTIGMPVPLMALMGLPRVTTPFPFNNGVFGRFSPDGRMPAVLQPGAGSASAFFGLFFTRVNQEYEFLGRSAYHAGATYTIKSEASGIDPGDQLVLFASFVKPVIKDYLAFDLAFVTFYQEADSYRGKFIEPVPTDGAGNPVDSWASASHVTFLVEDRPPFSEGWTGFIAPSAIFSPDPSIRITVSPLIRVIEPELGPAPSFVLRAAMEVIW